MLGHGNSQFADIILLALVAGFLILRLRAVLGRRDEGDVRPPPGPAGRGTPGAGGNVIDLQARPVNRPAEAPVASDPNAPFPGFDPEGFLAGARRAFEMILDAYVRGDLAALAPLLDRPVYANFETAVKARQQRGERLEVDFGGFRGIDIRSARTVGTMAEVVVRYVSDQTIVTRDAGGAVVDGDPGRAERVIDDWTFTRDLRSADPNWRLTATAVGNPAESGR